MIRRFMQDHPPDNVVAQDQIQVAPQDAHGAADGHGDVFDMGEMLSHHILNARYYEFPFGGKVDFPYWDPANTFGIDFSPTKHLALMLLAALLTVAVAIFASRRIASQGVTKAPSGLANAIETVVVFLRDDVCKNNIGHGYRPFVPLVLTLFFFILIMNLLGLIPGGGTATGNLSITAALAVITFVVVEVSGFLKLGFRGYMKTIFFVPPDMGPVEKFLVMCLMAPVELLGKFTKPFALAIRLFANMTAGHMLIFSLLGMIFIFANMAFVKWFVLGASVGAVSAIMLMELLIAVIQAYVFAMLAAVFIGLMQHEH